HTVPGTANSVSGSYQGSGVIEFCAGGDFCIAAFPSNNGGRTFRIPRGSGGGLGTATQISTVPIHCSYAGGGDNRGMLFDDPSGAASLYILEKGGSNRVWKYQDGNWVIKTYTHPFPRGDSTSDTNWCVASCRPLGV